MTHYYLYRVANKVNGKIYVGVHKTQRPDDGYMGSGKVIRDAIRKHGPENFEKEILETFDNAADMFKREAEVVTEEFLARPDVYNLRRGGHGGFDYINSSGLNNLDGKHRKARAALGVKYPRGTAFVCHSDETKRKISEANKGRSGTFTGKRHTILTRQKLSEIAKNRTSNSQSGSFWITDGVDNRKLKFGSTIPLGWYKGRHFNK